MGIAARKLSSAMSAAKAASDHIKHWVVSTPADDWGSMGVFSDGSYGTPEGVMFSFPVTISNGKWSIVQGLEMSDFAKEKLALTGAELCEERNEAMEVCKKWVFSGPALPGIKKGASPGVVVYVVQTVLLDYTVTI